MVKYRLEVYAAVEPIKREEPAPSGANASSASAAGKDGFLSHVSMFNPRFKFKTHLDIIKIAAMYLVLVNHTMEKNFWLYAAVQEQPWHWLLLAHSILVKVAVPLFFMCSGTLLLGREETYDRLLLHRVLRYAGILLGASFVSYLYYTGRYQPITFVGFLDALYRNTVSLHFWYLYSYICMLLMLPFLRKIAQGMREADFYWLVLMHLTANMIPFLDYVLYQGTAYHTTHLSLFVNANYVAFPLMGYYIENRMDTRKISAEGLSVLLLGSLLAIYITVTMMEWRVRTDGGWNYNNLEAYLGTLISIPSITIFYGLKLLTAKWKIKRRTALIINIAGSCTFGVYLFEGFWREKAGFVYDFFLPWIGTFFAVMVQMAVALLMGLAATFLVKLIPEFFRAALALMGWDRNLGSAGKSS